MSAKIIFTILFTFVIKYSLCQELQNWHHKDYEKDTIPGISLYRTYENILNHKEGREVIVAVLDMSIDTNHEDLKNSIWQNHNEIPNNNIDDDNNGYIDDINGWNFLGNKNGDSKIFVNYEYTRILKKYDSIFKNATINQKDSEVYKNYIKAKDKYKERLEFAKEDSAYIDMAATSKNKVRVFLSDYFDNNDYSIEDLEKLGKKHPNDSLVQNNVLIMSNFIKYKFTEDYVNEYKFTANERLQKLLNLNYDDRLITEDNPDDINDSNYGNPIINQNLHLAEHSTLMSGIIAGTRNNGIGIDGFSNNIKIMPLVISGYGDEHDKDIALAIRYAVDNGANVINMSFGKEFSLYPEWVYEALKYAEKSNVLVVSSAGNNGANINYYPNDTHLGKEVSNNFISVGSSTYHFNEKLLNPKSNYSKTNVDIFAPGYKIYTTTTKKEKYRYTSGTSISSAIVSGVGALIYSYYPNLTASEVKQIIMESGVEYTIPVKVATKEDKERTIPFNELSKSGKIVNAYNALLMAEEIAKEK